MSMRWVWMVVVAGALLSAPGWIPGAQGAPKSAKSTAVRGAREQVAQAAAALKKLGLYSGDTSGKWNPDLHAAVSAFQKRHGLKETGRLNKETRKALGLDDGAGRGDAAPAKAKSAEGMDP